MLRWELEHGPHLEYSLAQLRNGEDPPRESYTPPRLRGDCRWIMEAWRDLRRVCENGTTPSEWAAWCALQGVEDDMARLGWACVRDLDRVWLQHRADEREQRRKDREG